MLSCDCNYHENLEWWYPDPLDFVTFSGTRRKRCCSCKQTKIAPGDACLKFTRFRNPRDEIEEKIMGDAIPMASYFMCEKCGEIFLNLNAIGYCLDITEPMSEYLAEYQEMTGFKNGTTR